MKRTYVRATHRLSGDEALQVEIQLANDYPDALATARAEAVRGVKDMLVTAMAVDQAMAPDEAEPDGKGAAPSA